MRVRTEVEQLPAEWRSNGPADPLAVEQLARAGDIPLPTDYLDFLRRHDGGEGFAGDGYLILWRAGEVIANNQGYAVDEFAPGLFLIGSDGGGEAFGFDLREADRVIVSIPFIGLDWEEARIVAGDIKGLFEFVSLPVEAMKNDE